MGSEVQILPGPPLLGPGEGWLRCRPVGGVAQLGEHLLCKQGVTGSIPVVSIGVAQYRGQFEFGGCACLDPVFQVGACAVVLVFVSVNQVLVRLWTRVPGPGSGAMACVSMTRQSACSAWVMARRSMACLTGKCVLRGMAAPVIGGEGSEALCERLIGSGGSRTARAVAETPIRTIL